MWCQVYHGSKISGSQQSFLTETAFTSSNDARKVQTVSATMGYCFVSECNQAQECHTCQFFHFFLPYLQDHGLLSSRNFASKAKRRKQVFLSTSRKTTQMSTSAWGMSFLQYLPLPFSTKTTPTAHNSTPGGVRHEIRPIRMRHL